MSLLLAVTVSLSSLVSLFALCALAYLVYLFIFYFWIQPHAFQQYWRSQGIDGPAYNFPLGELAAMHSAHVKDEVVEYAVRQSAQYGLIHTSVVGPMQSVLCNDPEMAKAIFTTKAHCYHKGTEAQKEPWRPLLHNGLLLSENEYWKHQRALLSPSFHFWYLQEILPIVVECMQAWCDKVDAKIAAAAVAKGVAAAESEVELEMAHELATITLDSVATAAFGQGFHSSPERADLLLNSIKTVMETMQERTVNLTAYLPIVKHLPLPSLRRIQQGCATIDSICSEIVRDRKRGATTVVKGGEHAGSELLRQRAGGGEVQRRHDLLDLLLDAQQSAPAGHVLTDRGVQDEAITFIFAGAETTSNQCTWMLWRMLTEKPTKEGELSVLQKCIEEADRVCGVDENGLPAAPTIEQLKELKYLEAVAYEALRLRPPAPIINKYCVEAHDIPLPSRGRSIHIPKGTTIILNANVVHRLPDFWPDPETFNPDRFLSSAVGTAAGAAASTVITGANEADGSAVTDPSLLSSPSSPSSPSPDQRSPSPGISGSPTAANTTNGVSAATIARARRSAQPFAFLGFSAGPRKCIGKNLAMLEIKIIFTLLLQRFSIEVVPNQYIKPGALSRLPKAGIRMILRKRTLPIGSIQLPDPSPDTNGRSSSDVSTADAALRNRVVLRPIGLI